MSKLTKGFFEEHGRQGGRKSRAQLSPEERREAARRAADARWNLHTIVRACVLGSEGDPKYVKMGVERTLKSEPKMILRHWEELLALAARPARRQEHEVEWALRLVNDLMQEIGLGVVASRSSYVSKVARGL